MTRQWTGAALLAVAVVVAGCQGSGGGGPEGETACLGTASLVHANGRFFRYVRQRDATAIDVSDDDGATWQAGPHALKELGRPVFGNGVFFASAPSQAVEPSSFRSTDGLTWEGGDELHRGAVAFGDGLFVWVNDAGIFTSPDALAWTLRDPTKFVVEASVSFHDGLFVASGVGVAEGTETVAADSVLTS
ncbi:MAG TPA: hypothetical protein VHB21_20255, partial [Minicystis sp.]|nr:hypothetical protein [Minicystis sp.]